MLHNRFGRVAPTAGRRLRLSAIITRTKRARVKTFMPNRMSLVSIAPRRSAYGLNPRRRSIGELRRPVATGARSVRQPRAQSLRIERGAHLGIVVEIHIDVAAA